MLVMIGMCSYIEAFVDDLVKIVANLDEFLLFRISNNNNIIEMPIAHDLLKELIHVHNEILK